ncbi:ATP-binding cassette domain-containing protein [Periweissella cryptocerci]|uniref:ATP-binding cassette domain-containing protein n=1 Tax=Periweissella cryptocerci TaxID=2506420 RepID=A0A4P6YTJ6_9LACO|nr:ATP-binding cassette domain-containing protein [Periweissella cryptocerci]QBO36078.1 ATP-binding cassette domain-containing protein [Periweissella cryptocerci]
MTKTMLEIKNLATYVQKGTPDQTQILKGINLTIDDGDFITVLGSNGAGKSTLFNVIAGNLAADEGQVLVGDTDITHYSETKRTKYMSRVFQDPKLGTAPRMTVAENLLLAEKRGQHRTLKSRNLNQHMEKYRALTATMGNGLDSRLNTPAGELSGGQRQALSFLMATLRRPDLLLLDEHTAALDPKTSEQLMHVTNQRISEDKLTALMITHHLEDALTYGNRLIALHDGQITLDVRGAEKDKLTKADLLQYFEAY